MTGRQLLHEFDIGEARPSPSPGAVPAKSCKIIGIGGAGCNFVLATLRNGAALKSAQWVPEFICIDFERELRRCVKAYKAIKPRGLPIKTFALEVFGSPDRANRGRVAAFRQRDALSSMFEHTDVIFLVAGLGGGTGGGASTIMAKLARATGALAIAAVITPFEFEGMRRHRITNTAISHLKREADSIVCFSNEELMGITSDDIRQDDFFSCQNHSIAIYLRGLMDFVNRCPP